MAKVNRRIYTRTDKEGRAVSGKESGEGRWDA
jgi:hypothetical protein